MKAGQMKDKKKGKSKAKVGPKVKSDKKANGSVRVRLVDRVKSKSKKMSSASGGVSGKAKTKSVTEILQLLLECSSVALLAAAVIADSRRCWELLMHKARALTRSVTGRSRGGKPYLSVMFEGLLKPPDMLAKRRSRNMNGT